MLFSRTTRLIRGLPMLCRVLLRLLLKHLLFEALYIGIFLIVIFAYFSLYKIGRSPGVKNTRQESTSVLRTREGSRR